MTCGSIQRSVGLLVRLALTLLLLQGANPVGQVSKRPVTAGNAFKTSMLELVAHLEAKVKGRGGKGCTFSHAGLVQCSARSGGTPVGSGEQVVQMMGAHAHTHTHTHTHIQILFCSLIHLDGKRVPSSAWDLPCSYGSSC